MMRAAGASDAASTVGVDDHDAPVEHTLPLADHGMSASPALREAYAAQERAGVAIATRLDDTSEA
jgi:hypothetical protein